MKPSYIYFFPTIFILSLISPYAFGQTLQAIKKSEKEALEKAKQIYKQLKKGDDFGTLARHHSDDTYSARRGGNIGMADKGQMVEPYEKAALSLKPGEISKPVKSEYGYHIIQLLERKDSKYLTRHILVRIDP